MECEGGQVQRFDAVVMAVHGDDVLPLLGENATRQERDIFSSFAYSTR